MMKTCIHRALPLPAVLAASLIWAIFGCRQDANEFPRLGPELRPFVPTEVFKQERDLTVAFDLELRALNGLSELRVYKDELLYDQQTYEPNDLIATYPLAYQVENLPDGSRITFRFELTDQQGMEATPYAFEVEVGPPFSITDDELNGQPVKRVSGRINRDITFSAAHRYLLDGLVSVEGNRTLTIAPGTKVLALAFDDARDSRLAITQGSRLVAAGTADQPIVFTSSRTLEGSAQWGDWAGIFLYGRAPTNQGASVFEEGFTYGGNQLNDNSGQIRYIRIEYAGKNDADAIQFYGVGSATLLSHICIWNCYDNGVRFKGGAADLKYLAVIDHGAYGLWAEHGWRGRGQFWVFQTQIAATIIPVNFNNIARCVELRNDGSNFLLQPATYAKLANITMIGNGNTDLDGTRRGLRCRTGAMGLLKNIIATNFPDDAVRVEDVPQEQLENGTMQLAHVRAFANRSDFDELAEDYFAPEPAFDVNTDPVPGITPDNFVGSVPSPFDPANDPSFGAWFDSAPFIGAIKDPANDWTSVGNWVKNQDGSIR